ncbi:baseplate hub [Synechococcus phage Syn19]|uniref:Baseplate hub subunit n=2 Tax=Pontusvirus syn19 TaxID=2734134 RepID=M4SNX4_9CAUD|nr:baseplate hub [Synechococcus phage Syn19]ADO99540.1 baseplate hub subunit [Synechococcus phage Syn19]AGH56431.1 hypothetical protein CPTG_00140 [Cyanophage Syn2]
MALPKLNAPKYKMKLPSDGRTVNFRPFLVKEEKLLLVATETGGQDGLFEAIKTIIQDCTDIANVEDLATFDIEYVFLQIRTKSVGETVNVQVTCPDDNETTVEAEIPLDDIKVKKTRGHKNEIKLDDSIIVTMKYPNLDTFVEMNIGDAEDQGVEQIFKMAASCIKTIADTEQVYDCADSTDAEIMEFFESLTSTQFQEIQKFFETMPKLAYTLKVTNPETGVESEVELEGLASFFA